MDILTLHNEAHPLGRRSVACRRYWSYRPFRKAQQSKPTRAVYGNIDGHQIRAACPENQIFNCEKVNIFIRHIGGYPGQYTATTKTLLDQLKPQLYICGHSHILKVQNDLKRKLLHMNPGAAGRSGFHKVRTLLRFTIDQDK